MNIELAERRFPIPDMPPAQEGTGSPATMDDAYDVRAAGAAGTPRGKELRISRMMHLGLLMQVLNPRSKSMLLPKRLIRLSMSKLMVRILLVQSRLR
jgi:hypothetical protein